MDTIKIGKFLKELRKEKGLTQEQLGEKVGVTNKTVSRWENGHYLPPVECLSIMSELYNVSINEMIAGQRLEKEEFEALISATDNNLSEALELSESVYKKRERSLTIAFILSTILAMVLILIIPFDRGDMLRSILSIFLIIALIFIGNTVNIVALAMNKER